MTHNGGTVMGTEQCVNLLEHINYQVVYKAPTSKSAFPQKERGPGGRMSTWLGVSQTCLKPGHTH